MPLVVTGCAVGSYHEQVTVIIRSAGGRRAQPSGAQIWAPCHLQLNGRVPYRPKPVGDREPEQKFRV